MRLRIEIDGESHFDGVGVDKDAQREIDLGKYGIKLIRFDNEEVLRDVEAVVEVLAEVIENRVEELGLGEN